MIWLVFIDMPNIVKYNLSTSPNSIQSGNFNIGVNNTETDLSEFYTGICPIEEGYTIYIDKASNGPSIYAPKDDAELVEITNVLGGNVSTPEDALVWINSQSTMTVLNINYPPIVTSGVSLNLDAGFVSSYPKTEQFWYDLSGNEYYGSFAGGYSFNRKFGGIFVFEGGYAESIGIESSFSFIQNTGIFTICAMVNFGTPGPPGSFGLMATFRNGPGEKGFRIVATPNNELVFQMTNGDDYLVNDTIADYFVNETWAFITIVGDGENTLYYKDGEYLETISFQNNLSTLDSARELIVGDAGVDNTWVGAVMQTLIYNRVLKEEEVKQNYNAVLQKFIPPSSRLLLDAQNTNLYANSRTTVYDVSQYALTGTLASAQQYVADGNGSWSFNGEDDFISNIGNLATFDFIQNTAIFTICVWVKLTDLSTNKLITIIGNNSRRFSEQGFQLSRGDARRSIRFSMTGGGEFIYDEQIDDYFSLDEWVFITIVGDGTNISYYKNGNLFETGSQTISTVSSGESGRSLSVGGGEEEPTMHWIGNISQALIYYDSLSSDTIATIFKATKTRYGL